jgi:GNAT superfamily N-acetyltransferase
MTPRKAINLLAREPSSIVAPAVVGVAWQLEELAPDLDTQAFIVKDDAPIVARLAVECIGRMFRREFDYDGTPYVAEDPDGQQRCVLWVALPRFEDGYVAVGAAGFREGITYTNVPGPVTEMRWAWLHPHYRRRGVLSAAWPHLVNRFGPFGLQPPLSPAMQAFAASRPHRLLPVEGSSKGYPLYCRG